MNRTSRIITFIIAAGLSYGSLFAFVGPEKVKTWHKQRIHHHGHHHDHHCGPNDNRDKEEIENL
jgi:hypothetical protein